jgi:hypothetical protein
MGSCTPLRPGRLRAQWRPSTRPAGRSRP